MEVCRVPGAKARHFFQDPRLYRVLDHQYDLAILWLGSNDIRRDTQVGEFLGIINNIATALRDRCGAQVHICHIEPRVFPPWGRGSAWMDDEKYRLIAKAVNRRLPRVVKWAKWLSFTARPFHNSLKIDGVHFSPEGRQHVNQKIKNAIEYEAARWRSIQAMGGYWAKEDQRQ